MLELRPVDSKKLERLIEQASTSGGSERANFQTFLQRLTDALGLPAPDLSAEHNERNDYVFERRVDFKHPNGTTTPGFIDLYRRGKFILEAKQSAKRLVRKADENQLLLMPEDAAQPRAGHAKRGTRMWDQVMLAARRQAEDYARALPVEHGYPPFLLIMDVGHVIEVYADFSGQGKNYAHFPDRRSYRIGIEDLREKDVQERLRTIWTDPPALDPARISAEVTRDIAERLANIARRLEGKHDAGEVAEFLMRCLFTMFAEDVELLPRQSFENLLEQLKAKPETFVPALEHLWGTMDKGGYEPRMNLVLKRFNGTLFKHRKALPLDGDGIHEPWVAAKRDWRDVEPAIFGTLLERALDPRERAKLGAHYTPRAYVERLVVPTIIEPLRADWADVQVRAEELRNKQDQRGALRTVQEFHRKLCMTRVLDPACGTGNFLYVSLELMKRLEGEVLEAIAALGGEPSRIIDHQEVFGADVAGRILSRKAGRFTVDPHQFYGLELNPRAVVIADLVLWIGYLKWQLKTAGLESITEPVLDAYGTIKQQDAVLAYDERRLVKDANGKPLSRWDGVTMKAHPITGEDVPDPDARVEIYDYLKPRPADWPEVEFIVGNPPFIGGKDMRQELGDGYAEACWQARKHVPGGADFVMHFWDEAAVRLARTTIGKGKETSFDPLRRFGFITTNSITQTFSRRVVERALSAKEPVSILFAVPDHPWLKAPDKAAVRIAMTVAERGLHEGILGEVVSERELSTDTPQVTIDRSEGKITAKLTIGPNLGLLYPLQSNVDIGLKGFELGTQSLLIDNSIAVGLVRKDPRIEKYIFSYMNGTDLKNGRTSRSVIDTIPDDWDIISKIPTLANFLLSEVQDARNPNSDAHVLNRWWQFRRTGAAIRSAIAGTERFCATTRTAKHRIFSFLPQATRAESKIVIVAVSNPEFLTILNSRIHAYFAENTGGWQGVGNDPVYQHTETFDPFPFPACVTDDSNPKLRARLADIGERLDAFRKERLAAHDFLTMTGIYNVLERLRELDCKCDVPPLTQKEKDIHEAGLVSVLKSIHDDIDHAVFEAYGWSDLADRLVGKPGATVPSPHKSEDQEAAEEELLTRLVALNLERQAEEKRGVVRWLRPEYQIPKLGHKVAQEQSELDVGEIVAAAGKPKWPAEGLAQIRIVRDVLARAPAPARPAEIATAFDGRNTPARRSRIEEVLETLVATGGARTGQLDGETRYFVPR